MGRDHPTFRRKSVERSEASQWDKVAVVCGGSEEALGAALSADPLHQAHMAELQPLAGKRILEIGAGLGVLTSELAMAAAQVVALDISAESLTTLLRRTETRGLSSTVRPVLASAHDLPFRDASFDLVTGRFILHHLDVTVAGREIARVLVPGGRAVFTENSARSGILMFARRHLCGRFGIPKWSTPDEHPLTRTELDALRGRFRRMRLVHPRFDWFFLLNAKLFGYRHAGANRVLGQLDRAVPVLLPFMRRYAYYQVIVLER